MYFRLILFIFVSVLATGVVAAAIQRSETDPGLSRPEPLVTRTEALVLEKVRTLYETDLPGAIDHLKKNITPDSSAALDFALGNLHVQGDHLDAAVLAYREALKKHPAFHRARGNLAQILIQSKKFDEAVTILGQSFLYPGIRPSEYSLLGYAYLMKEMPVSAESAYRQAVLRDHEDINARIGLVKALMGQEKWKEVRSLLLEILDEKGDRIELWQLLANACLALDKVEEAAATLEAARRLDLATPELLVNLGDIYLHQEQYDDAHEVYQKAIEGGSLSGKEELRVLRTLVALGQWKEVIGLLSRVEVSTFNKTDRIALQLIQSKIYFHKDDLNAARTEIEALLDMDPLHGEALLLLGDLLVREEHLSDAFLYYQRAGRAMKTPVPSLLKQAQLAIDQGDYKNAVVHLETAWQYSPAKHIEKTLGQLKRLLALRN